MDENDVDRLFREGYDCSQIVLADVIDRFGFSVEDANRMASCLGLGLLKGSICGAALGAIIAIGLKYGNVKPNDTATKLTMIEKREEFLKRFEEMNGSILCPDLLARNVTSVDEMIVASGDGVFLECPKYCVNASIILHDML